MRGRYVARLAETAHDVDRVLDLRTQQFRGGQGTDRDRFDAQCLHLMVEDRGTGAVRGACRVQCFATGAGLAQGYSGARYGLGGFAGCVGPVLEMGRFCIVPGAGDADVLRIAWGGLTRLVDRLGVRLLVGCSSFPGIAVERYSEAFALLCADHLAPKVWRPTVRAEDVLDLAAHAAPAHAWERARALAALPPLLRTYLSMGGWVSDHAVIDRDLGTLHVFTGLEIAGIPPARARALRLVAG